MSRGKMNPKSAIAYALILFSGPAGWAQTESEVWPTGDNGPMVWPPELSNPWWDAQKKYPEGGAPPPLDMFSRIKCEGGSKVAIKSTNSAPWEQSRWHPPEYAFDKYTVSRWSSNSAAEKWLAADMGSEKTVNRVYLIWETAYGKDYDIQFSKDSIVWTTAKQVRGGNGQADVVDLEGKGRYIRMMGVATGSPYGYSLYEFTICSADGATPLKRPETGRASAKGWSLVLDSRGLPQGAGAFDLTGKAAAAGARKLPYANIVVAPLP